MLLLTGCGGTTTMRPTARLELSAAPSTITPVLCPAASCGALANQLEATAVVTVRDTGGAAGTIESAGLVLRRTSDSAILVNATPAVGTRFAAGGSVAVPIAVHWDRDQSTGPATLTVTINARDDNDHVVSAVLTIPVTVFAPPAD